jgi:dienelactone hydrolase
MCFSQVKMPFFILHGKADTVTDPEVSRALYERAASADKTLELYPGMWHGLTAGEPDENVELVFADIVAWLKERSQDGRVRATSETAAYQRASSELINIDSNSTSIRARPQGRRRGGFLCGQCRM